jgi:hypothetical protein
MGLTNFQPEGNLTISGIDMNRSAWAVLGDERGEGGLVRLWFEFDVRGEDRILPGVTGVIAYQRRITAKRHDLRTLVVGDVDQAGNPVADPAIGLENNLEYLRANVLAPVATSTGTRAAVLTLPSGATRTADVHVLGMTTQSYMLGPCGSILVGTLHISIPTGRFS